MAMGSPTTAHRDEREENGEDGEDGEEDEEVVEDEEDKEDEALELLELSELSETTAAAAATADDALSRSNHENILSPFNCPRPPSTPNALPQWYFINTKSRAPNASSRLS